MESQSENCEEFRHLGHLFIECMKERPQDICQIDAATGEEETNASVLNRSVRLARSLRGAGLRPGDVLSLGGRNHLDLHIPVYAAILTGLPVSGVDPLFKYVEIKKIFELSRPKIAFCEQEMYDVYSQVISDLALDTKLVTFGTGESSMARFMDTYDTHEASEHFIPADFDQNKIYAFLVSTSGTTGKLKLVALKHDLMISKFNKYIKLLTANGAYINQVYFNLSTINWISSFFNAVGLPLMRHTKLQTSNLDDFEHIIDVINNYKPLSALVSTTMMLSLLSRKEAVDLTCFRVLTVTGSKIHIDVLAEFRKLLHKDAVILEAYGMTETVGPCLLPNVRGPAGSCGRPSPSYQVKLVDPESGNEITEPNTPGELWVKGEMFSEYYNDPEETARAFSEDGFYKSGDLLYRDENDNYFYVDRLKSVFKYRSNLILPTEIEDVIREHPAVRAVCVCGAPHPLDGQRPVACVVPRPGQSVTEQEIKDLVAEKLSKNKELSGGVVFLDSLPMTSTDKVARGKLLQLITNMRSD